MHSWQLLYLCFCWCVCLCTHSLWCMSLWGNWSVRPANTAQIKSKHRTNPLTCCFALGYSGPSGGTDNIDWPGPTLASTLRQGLILRGTHPELALDPAIISVKHLDDQIEAFYLLKHSSIPARKYGCRHIKPEHLQLPAPLLLALGNLDLFVDWWQLHSASKYKIESVPPLNETEEREVICKSAELISHP